MNMRTRIERWGSIRVILVQISSDSVHFFGSYFN